MGWRGLLIFHISCWTLPFWEAPWSFFSCVLHHFRHLGRSLEVLRPRTLSQTCSPEEFRTGPAGWSHGVFRGMLWGPSPSLPWTLLEAQKKRPKMHRNAWWFLWLQDDGFIPASLLEMTLIQYENHRPNSRKEWQSSLIQYENHRPTSRIGWPTKTRVLDAFGHCSEHDEWCGFFSPL